jgi:hypothetical protein
MKVQIDLVDEYEALHFFRLHLGPCLKDDISHYV